MQRLFSMFPQGRAGLALLILRLALAAVLLNGLVRPAFLTVSTWWLAPPVAVAAGLVLGLLTPVMSALCILIELTAWTTRLEGMASTHLCAVLVAISLGMLGPGAYSLDAKLFGRRRVVLPEAGEPTTR